MISDNHIVDLWLQGMRYGEIQRALGCSQRDIDYAVKRRRRALGDPDFGRRQNRRTDRPAPAICECGEHAWVSLTRGYITLVSPEDIALIADHFWYAHRNVAGEHYAMRGGEGGRPEYLHREILGCPFEIEGDHENHVGTDNRRPNLRIATKKQNAHNRKKRKGCLSQYIGVTKAKSRRWDLRKPWVASIKVDGRSLNLGYFATEFEAAVAYDQAARKHRGRFGKLNFRPASVEEVSCERGAVA